MIVQRHREHAERFPKQSDWPVTPHSYNSAQWDAMGFGVFALRHMCYAL